MGKLRYSLAFGQNSWPYRKTWCLILGIFYLITCLIVVEIDETVRKEIMLEIETPEYLVDSKNCKILNIVPWNSEFKAIFQNKSPYKCSNKPLLTGIEYKKDRAYLYINKSVAQTYSSTDIECCYKLVYRGTKAEADLTINYTECKPFKNRLIIKATEVMVMCIEKYTARTIYSNVHSVAFKSKTILKKLERLQHKEKPPSVLLIGIDSISRLNFHRMFPQTKEYLDDSGWIEYKGYNKVGENTFPNLMALLTGRNLSKVDEVCNPHEVGILDNCNFIWKNFSESDYVTSYVEDSSRISTFTYLKKGFLNPPVDLYYRPYMMASEDLKTTYVDGVSFCGGPESFADRILGIIKDMVTQFGDHPKFGLFWANSFSHEDINTPRRMDDIFANFFEDLHQYLDNTLILFFSDHGIRFGAIRETKTGWYEERLPFAYFWVPHVFRERFPSEYSNLIQNSNKLTTAYDAHLTLQHILELYVENRTRLICDATPHCKSLFEDVGDRSCEDTSIPMHYCTCIGYRPIADSELIREAGRFAIMDLNAMIGTNENASVDCSLFRPEKITMAQIGSYKNASYLLFQVRTVPKAVFEFTLSLNEDANGDVAFKKEDGISRLDKYGPTSNCVNAMKMFCYCRSHVVLEMNFFSFWFEV